MVLCLTDIGRRYSISCLKGSAGYGGSEKLGR